MPHRRSISVASLAVLAAVVACGGDDGEIESDASRFCEQASTQRDLVLAPPVATEAELQASLEFYRLMGQLAPIAAAPRRGRRAGILR